MGVLAFFIFRLLRPSGVLRDYLSGSPNSLVAKLKYAFALAGVSLPISLALLTAAGYFYTAQTLFWRLFATCAFVTTLIVMRSVFVSNADAQASAPEYGTVTPASTRAGCGSETWWAIMVVIRAPLQGSSPKTNRQIFPLTACSLVILSSTGMSAAILIGMWMIWIQVLPALSMVGNFPALGKSRFRCGHLRTFDADVSHGGIWCN